MSFLPSLKTRLLTLGKRRGEGTVLDQESFSVDSSGYPASSNPSFSLASTTSEVVFAPPSTETYSFIGQGTPEWRLVPATWVVVLYEDKLCAFVHQ